jgi:hypothetical protein
LEKSFHAFLFSRDLEAVVQIAIQHELLAMNAAAAPLPHDRAGKLNAEIVKIQKTP